MKDGVWLGVGQTNWLNFERFLLEAETDGVGNPHRIDMLWATLRARVPSNQVWSQKLKICNPLHEDASWLSLLPSAIPDEQLARLARAIDFVLFMNPTWDNGYIRISHPNHIRMFVPGDLSMNLSTWASRVCPDDSIVVIQYITAEISALLRLVLYDILAVSVSKNQPFSRWRDEFGRNTGKVARLPSLSSL